MKRIAIVLGLTLFLGGVPLAARAQGIPEDDTDILDPDFLSDEGQQDLQRKLEQKGQGGPSSATEADAQGKSDAQGTPDAQQQPAEKGSDGAGFDTSVPDPVQNDADLVEQPLEDVLEADVLDAEQATPEVRDPAEKERIDEGVAEIQGKAEALQERLQDPTPVTEEEVAQAEADREAAVEETASVASEVEKVVDQGGGPPERGYGAPLEPVPSHENGGGSWSSSSRALGGVNGGGLAAADEGEGDGEGGGKMHSFFEKLLGAVVQGATKGLQLGAAAYRRRLAQERVNELKALADRLALSSRMEHRPYVDANVRRALSASGLGTRGRDTRLDDLILGGNRTPLQPSGGSSGSSTRVGDASLAPGSGSSVPRTVPRLPRKRDPITGVERVVIDMPLGTAPTTPLQPR